MNRLIIPGMAGLRALATVQQQFGNAKLVMIHVALNQKEDYEKRT